MNIRAFAESLPKEFYIWGTLNSMPYDFRRYAEVLEHVQGMTTPSNMHLLNLAVQQLGPAECYLEVGTWRGATLIGALLGNDAYGVAIDNDTMDEHDGDKRSSMDVWIDNVERFEMTDRAGYIDGEIPSVWGGLLLQGVMRQRKVGVYFFDGDKSTEQAAWEGIEGALPFLSSEALIVLDDANEINIRLAASKLCAAYPQHAFKILDIPTPGNCWPMWWNGVIAIAWKA